MRWDPWVSGLGRAHTALRRASMAGYPGDTRLSRIGEAAAPRRAKTGPGLRGKSHSNSLNAGKDRLSLDTQLSGFTTSSRRVEILDTLDARGLALPRHYLAIGTPRALGFVIDPTSVSREAIRPARATTVPATGGASAIPCRCTYKGTLQSS